MFKVEFLCSVSYSSDIIRFESIRFFFLRAILKNKVYVVVPTNLRTGVNESSKNVRNITALMLSKRETSLRN